LQPGLAAIRRVIERSRGTANPDLRAQRADCAEHNMIRDRHRLPGLAGIDRTLDRAFRGQTPSGRRREDNQLRIVAAFNRQVCSRLRDFFCFVLGVFGFARRKLRRLHNRRFTRYLNHFVTG
jgi:hypothetical protein